MKMILWTFATVMLLLGVPVSAQQNPEHENKNNPIEQLKQLVECQAVDLSLARLYEQNAATILALSGPNGQASFKPMIDSYRQMSAQQIQNAKAITEVVKQSLIPTIMEVTHTSMHDLFEEVNKHLSDSLNEITDVLNDKSSINMSFEDRVAAANLLDAESKRCDSFSATILRKHTF